MRARLFALPRHSYGVSVSAGASSELVVADVDAVDFWPDTGPFLSLPQQLSLQPATPSTATVTAASANFRHAPAISFSLKLSYTGRFKLP